MKVVDLHWEQNVPNRVSNNLEGGAGVGAIPNKMNLNGEQNALPVRVGVYGTVILNRRPV